jgi:hypothetical protein
VQNVQATDLDMLHLSLEISVLQHLHRHAYQDAISAVQSATELYIWKETDVEWCKKLQALGFSTTGICTSSSEYNT